MSLKRVHPRLLQQSRNVPVAKGGSDYERELLRTTFATRGRSTSGR